MFVELFVFTCCCLRVLELFAVVAAVDVAVAADVLVVCCFLAGCSFFCSDYPGVVFSVAAFWKLMIRTCFPSKDRLSPTTAHAYVVLDHAVQNLKNGSPRNEMSS